MKRKKLPFFIPMKYQEPVKPESPDELITQLVRQAEELRGALIAIINSHTYRFPIHGACPCAACANGVALVEKGN